MARHIAVYRREDLAYVTTPPAPDVNSPEYDQWEAQGNALCQYENPLGSEAAVREFWSEPATSLGLPLLASIYDEGFYNGVGWSGPELDRLAEELEVLEGYWKNMSFTETDRSDLAERMSFMRTAIQVAKQRDGVLTIA